MTFGLTEVMWLTLINAWGPTGFKRHAEKGLGACALDVSLHKLLCSRRSLLQALWLAQTREGPLLVWP